MIDDHFPIPLKNFAPLEIGRWGVTPGSEDFEGDIDEVRIVKSAQHPPDAFHARIQVSPPSLDFGPTLVGEHALSQLWISNTGIRETLNVASIVSTNRLYPRQLTFPFSPVSEALQLMYEPTAVHTGYRIGDHLPE